MVAGCSLEITCISTIDCGPKLVARQTSGAKYSRPQRRIDSGDDRRRHLAISRRRSGLHFSSCTSLPPSGDLALPFVDANLTAAQIVGNIDVYLFNGAMTAATNESLLDFLKSGKKIDKNRIHDAIGLAVASPDFQEY